MLNNTEIKECRNLVDFQVSYDTPVTTILNTHKMH